MSTSKTINEINILLLGETGVGKSTFINSFANYLTYETIEEALKSKPICLIPTRFFMSDKNYEQKEVKFGSDKNEYYEKIGASATQNCRTYCFKKCNTVVRLIDTPGIGDVRGLDQDKINLENLLKFIAEYEFLHLICILYKPDQQRMNSNFVYCIKQLLCQLQKDAKENILFVFTNSRSSLYRPKNTLALIKDILDNIKRNPPNIEIPLKKETIICLENDSFQYLIALQDGIIFEDEVKDEYCISWAKSVKECERLMAYITFGKNGKPLPPYPIQNILSINETRRLLVALNKPIVKITEKIGENLINLEICKNEVESLKDKVDFKKFLKKLKLNFAKIELNDISPLNSIFSNIFVYINNLIDIKKTNSEINSKESLIDLITDIHDQLVLEKKTIVHASAKFAYFLKLNALANYNDAYKEHLIMQIECASKSEDKETIDDRVNILKKILKDYEHETLILDESFKKSDDVMDIITLEKINDLIMQLYELEYSGKDIKKLHEESKIQQCKDVKVEVVYKFIKSISQRFFKYFS